VRILSLRRLTSQFLLIITVLTYPSVVAFHNFGAVDLFTGALLLSVVSIYFLQYKGYGFLALSILSLTVSIATYQAFVSVTSVLILILLLEKLTIRKDNIKVIVLSALKGFMVLVVSVALYYFVYRILDRLGLPGTTTYLNQDQIGHFVVADLPVWLLKTYVSVFRYIFGKGFQLSYIIQKYPQIICIGIVTLFAVIRLAKEGFFKQPTRVLLTLIILGLLPFAMNTIQFLSGGVFPHLLMTFAFIGPWLLVLQYGDWLFRELSAVRQKKILLRKCCAAICVILLCANAFYGYIVANADYVNRKMNYDASLSLATRIVDRIETIDGYMPETPVMIVGSLLSGYNTKQREGFELTNSITGSFSKTGQAMTYNDEYGSTIQWFISTVISTNMMFISVDELENYQKLDSVINLQSFPGKNCYTWVGNVLVFKVND